LLIGLALLLAVTTFTGLSFVEAQSSTVTVRSTPTPTPDDEVIKVDSDVVNVLFTAQDNSRRLLTDLKQEDVVLLEDGKQQETVAFTRQVDLPLSLAILIDTSASQERTLPEEKTAAIAFLESVIKPAKDEVSVISFTGEATLEQGMTNSLTRLRRAVEQVRFSPPAGYIGGGVTAGTPPVSSSQVQGSTAIWDAIWVTSDEILGPAPERTRRAIILLSDGVNTYGKKKLDDAVQAALRSEAIIYAVGIGDNFYSGVDKGSLNKIAERTGGRAYFPRDESDLRDAFRQIQDEMRSQYLIAYEPSNQNRDGSFRRIEIQLAAPKLQKDRIKLTHRQGYFAKSGNKK
jgi:VWFA-related protein